MNNDDLIEKLKLMLAERMLEIEEYKRLLEENGKFASEVDDLNWRVEFIRGELESEKKKSEYLDKQCQMLSNKIKILEGELEECQNL